MKKNRVAQGLLSVALAAFCAVVLASEAPLMPDKVVQNRVFNNSFVPLGASEHQETNVDLDNVKQFESGDKQVALLELYSSEGCSSCPPADRWMSTWKDNPALWKEMVPVVFHVDYWDWMGWKDRFAKPVFTQRQKAYNSAGLSNSVYTPGFFLNGEEWRGWFRQQKPISNSDNIVGNLKALVRVENVSATYFPDSTHVAAADNGEFFLHIALLGVDELVKVKHGENAGRALNHDFVVLNYQKQSAKLGEGSVKWQLSLPTLDALSSTSPAGRKAIAMWVTQGQKIQPLQATGAWLN